MGLTILQTKITVPYVHPHLVPRSRISGQIDSGIRQGHNLTLVAAPVGFGKSTALSLWTLNSQRKVAWYSLEHSDNDEYVFWSYFLASIQVINPSFGNMIVKRLPHLAPANIKNILPDLLNELVSEKETMTLVLDDFHVIENPEIQDGILFLLSHPSPSFHLMIATRTDPALPLARMRARRCLTEIRIEDLRFTENETLTFLNDIMHLELDEEDVQQLEKRTEGWCVGLLLAAQSMQGRHDKHDFITSFSGSHHYIIEYLVDEVLNRQDEKIRNFLLQSSILNRMCGSLCNAVLLSDDSEEILKRLSRENLFIIPLDADHHWYRYHQLFADLLLNSLKKEKAIDEINILQQRASCWFREAGEFDLAVNYAIDAGDYDNAADMVEQFGSILIAEGRVKTVKEWFDGLPNSSIKPRPMLRLLHAWTFSLSGQLHIAEKILLETKTELDQLPDSADNRKIRGNQAALLTGIYTHSNDPDRIIRASKEALSYLAEDDWMMRARVEIALATAFSYSDEMNKSMATYRNARDHALKAHNAFLASTAIEMLAGIQIYHQSDLLEAEKLLEGVLESGKIRNDVYQPFTGTAHILLADIFLERNQLDKAGIMLERGTALLEQGGFSHSLTHAYCAKARHALASGDFDEAITAMHTAGQAAQSNPLMHIMIHNLTCQVNLSLLLNDIDAACRWASGDQNILGTNLPQEIPTYLKETQQLAISRVNFAQGKFRQTLELLDEIQPTAEVAKRNRHLLEIHLQRTLTYHKLGMTEPAKKEMSNALKLAMPQNCLRPFIEAGSPVAEILTTMEIEEQYAEFTAELVNVSPHNIRAVEIKNQPPIPQNLLVEPLTEREFVVLGLMCEGYSNQQIAETLFVSVNTVKKHTSNIYGKLGVRNRAQAVLSAREKNLI